jgi:glycerophosphoryl diester phosphodiesterase
MRSLPLLLLAALAAVVLAVAPAGAAAQEPPGGATVAPLVEQPLVIAHRGASGHRPEHTLAAYELGARLGADFIEPDLVSTRDGVLVARHENEIAGTTDVETRPEFADRRTTKTIDGVSYTGWFTEDFTLAELRTLRAEERIPAVRPRNTLYDRRYRIPTLQQVIDLAQRLGRELGRPIGIYPETKHPTYHRSIGLPLEGRLVRTLRRNGLDDADDPVFVQSFEVANLRALDDQIEAPLVQLYGAPATRPPDGTALTYAELATRTGLEGVAGYADGVGPAKDYVIGRAADGTLLPAPTTFVADAHAAGLQVHPYTFRNENTFLPADLRRGDDPAAFGDAFGEYARFFAAGVDGVFSDHPDTAVEARDAVEGED